MDAYSASRDLPIGHYDRKRTEESLVEEYASCSLQEARWQKHLKRGEHFLKPQEARRLVDDVCLKLGEEPPRQLVFGSPDVHAAAAAHCDVRKKELHFKFWEGCRTVVLVHELTHLCGAHRHDRTFCELELLVLEAATQVLKRYRELKACPWLKES